MKLLSCAAIIFSLFFMNACSSSSSNVKPIRRVVPSMQTAQETAMNYPAINSEEDALKSAERHLALRQRSWGKIVGVQELDNEYYVSFETPKRELRLIGQRILVVDKNSGVVTARKRR